MCDEKSNIIDGDQIIAALATRWKNKKMLKGGENVGEGSSSVMEDVSVYDERKKIVDQTLAEMGAKVVKEEK